MVTFFPPHLTAACDSEADSGKSSNDVFIGPKTLARSYGLFLDELNQARILVSLAPTSAKPRIGMLRFMRDMLKLIWWVVIGLFRSRASLVAEMDASGSLGDSRWKTLMKF